MIRARRTPVAHRAGAARGGWLLPALAAALAVLALGWTALAAISEPAWTERRQRVLAMSPAEQEELLRRFERFGKLPPEEQQRLRRLEEELSAAPDNDSLRLVMQRYEQWLAMISLAQRNEVLRLPADERVQHVAEAREVERTRLARRLPPEDAVVLWRWFTPVLVERMPPNYRDQWQQFGEGERQRRLVSAVWQFWIGRDVEPRPRLTANELDRLRESISPEARQRLDSQPTAEDQQALVLDWLRQALQRRTGEQEMMRFAESLSDAERQRLTALPRDAMREELLDMMRRRYYTRGPGPRDPQRGDGPGPGIRRPPGNGPGPGDRPGFDPPPFEGRPPQPRGPGEPRGPGGEPRPGNRPPPPQPPVQGGPRPEV